VQDVRVDTNALDYAILLTYFVVVLGVGFAAKRYIRTSLDYFVAGRSLPAWITGLAFISANLGAIEVLGMGANGAQYGVATVNYYWIGAIPAMVFLGLVSLARAAPAAAPPRPRRRHRRPDIRATRPRDRARRAAPPRAT
jgi:SSS family solute:Na+ symporter